MVVAYTPKPGQFSKFEALRAERRPLLVGLIALLLFMLADGVLLGLLIADVFGGRWTWIWPIAIAMIILLAAMPWVSRQNVRHLDRAARRRIALMRGGQAEVLVSMILRDRLSDRWHLFDNLPLDASSDIDHVLVGPMGLFIISTKSHRGLFHCTSEHGGPTHNDEPVDWPQDVTRQAMRLKDQLAVVEPAQPPWLQTVLVLPFAYIRDEPRDRSWPGVGAVWILNDDMLLDAINPDKSHRRLSDQEVRRWAAALQRLHQRHDDPSTVERSD